MNVYKLHFLLHLTLKCINKFNKFKINKLHILKNKI